MCIEVKHKKLIGFILIVALICILNHCCGWSKTLGNMGNLEFLKSMVSENFLLAAGLYTVITIVACIVLALPGITFAVFAGLLFGPWWGILICLIATTAGAAAAFLAGRYFLKDAIKPMVMKNKQLKRLLFDEHGKKDLLLLMITRLVPLFPYNIQNFAYGITDISFTHYTLYTFIFMLPGVSFITIGSAGLADADNRVFYLTLATLLFIAVFLIGGWLKRKYEIAKE